MVNKSIIEDAFDAAGVKFDREAFAANYDPMVRYEFEKHPQPSSTVDRLRKSETYANLYAQDSGRETLQDAIGSPTPGVYFGVRGLHHATTQYLKDRERDSKRRHLLVA